MKKDTKEKLVAISLISGVIILIIINFTGFGGGYSEGERTGTLTKFSKKGLIFKTWEGQMNLGGMVPDSENHMIPNIFRFSVTDDKVAKNILESMRAGKKVSLKYTQWIISPKPIMGTDYDVISIK